MLNKVQAKLALSGAAVLAALAISGCGSGSSPKSSTSTAMPTFSPGAGTYNASQTVTISDPTSGAVLYCTTDGSTPTTASPKCSQPTTVYQTEFLQAIAVAPGASPSGVASAAYTIDLSAAATPTFSPAGGTFTAPQTVTLSDATTGANIYYTTDGSTPTASSTLYTAPVMVSATETISAIAVASGYSNSGIAVATYSITAPVATPAFSVPSGSYTAAQTVTITDATPNAAIYYTTDGSTPTSASTAYSSPISVTQTQVISAIAILGNQSSAVSIAAYTIGASGEGGGAPLAPVFSLAAGTYTSAQTVSLSDLTTDAAIYYTTDGSTPTASSTAYTAPINVTQTETISAIAILAGVGSSVVTATYTISVPIAAPVFSVPSGSYMAAQSVTLTDATAGAAIYYTLDGSTPTASSTAYTAPISVTQTEVVSAIAILGASSSPIVSAAYTISVPVAAPVFSVPSGNYTAAQSVTLTDATAGAAIYYTLDGSVPSASSTAYTAPISVTQNEVISAIAVLGLASSPVVNAAYTITTIIAAPVFAPPTGSYLTTQSVTITDATPNSTIYYAVNGTATTSSTLYTGAISVTQTESISAIAVVGVNSSVLSTAAYSISAAVPPPTFSPKGGNVAVGQAITIGAGNANTAIYYTTDGTTPNSKSSTKYTAPIPLNQVGTVTIMAIAVDSTISSAVATATYTVKQPTPVPTFMPATGASLIVGGTVTISDTDAAATIYYTLDGSQPNSLSMKYSAAIPVSTTGNLTVNAVAIDAGVASAVGTATYTVSPASVATPTITPANGAVTSPATITVTDTDKSATIYYTLDGSTPSATSTKYSAPFTLTATGPVTVTAIAIDGQTSSMVATATYTVSPASVAAPSITPASGPVTAGATVTITDSDTSAAIYYTLDGSTPSQASTKYNGSFALTATGTVTVKAIAIDGATSSTVATATYAVAGAGPSISVTVLSGNLPVIGASVQLYAAGVADGDAGYGTAATKVGAEVTTSATGVASIPVDCPTTPTGALVYLIASGGNVTATGASNGDLEMMTALGLCGNLASGAAYTINEATTVASAYALSAFMTTAPNVGSSTANYAVGLANAFAAVNNLVDTSAGNPTSGMVLAHTPAYPTDLAGDTPILNNSTVPTARINTLANMLNSCTSTDGSGGGCATLFNTVNPSGTAPANTLQAALAIAQNPVANPANLFALGSSGFFTPVLGGAPNDWTLALTFTGGGLGLSLATQPMVTYPFGGAPKTGPLAIVNTSLAIDAQGNVWVTAYADDQSNFEEPEDSQATLLAEFNNLGAPVTPAAKLTTDATPVLTFGGYQPQPTTSDPDTLGLALISSAIDGVGNLWLGDSSVGNLYQVSSTLSTLQTPMAVGQPINSIAIDGTSGMNIWAAGSRSLNEYSNAGVQLLSSDGGNGNGIAYQVLSSLTFDSSGGLWGTDSGAADMYSIDTTTTLVITDLFPSSNGWYDVTLAAGLDGNIYGCGETGGMALDVFSAGAQTHSYPIATTKRGCGNQLVLDGQSHLFAISNVNAALPVAAVDELTLQGTVISGANGYTGTSIGEPPTLNPDNAYFLPVPGVSGAFDSSGNLWVLNNDTNAPSPNNGETGVPGNVLVEFIGIGAPVATPTSVALKNGQLGIRP